MTAVERAQTMERLLERRVALAHLPTPVQALPRLSRELGVALWIKRDDLTESVASGNKIRKLEYLLHAAREQGADTLVTCGGVQSNHCRAVAWAAAREGMGCALLLRGEPPEPPQGNLLLDRVLGAQVHFHSRSDFTRIDALQHALCRRLQDAGRRPYWIPMGGSNATGTLGYVAMAGELQGQTPAFDHHYLAMGSGGTYAGLWLGARHFGLSGKIHGIAVCDDVPTFAAEVRRIADEFAAWYGLPVETAGSAQGMDGGFVGRGYALNTPEELQTLLRLARLEGLVLDPVYTLKAFLGMLAHIRQGIVRPGERVLFLHSGGHAGLPAKAQELAPLLPGEAP
jgi:D-cysteine desulfhydrase